MGGGWKDGRRGFRVFNDAWVGFSGIGSSHRRVVRDPRRCACVKIRRIVSLFVRGGQHTVFVKYRALWSARSSPSLAFFLVVIPQGLLIRKHPLNRNPPISLIASRSFENLFRSLFFSFSIIFVSIRKVFASCVARGSRLRFRFGAKCMEGIVESCLFKSFASFNEAFQTEGM